MIDLFKNIIDLTAEMRRACDADSLNNAFRALLACLGPFAHAAGTVHKTRRDERYLIDTTYPAHWMEHYTRNNYQNIDPVIDPVNHGLTPYNWDQAYICNADQKKIMNEFRDVGFQAGHAIPLHLTPGMLLLVSVASPEKEIDFQTQALIQLIVGQYHTRYCQLAMLITYDEKPLMTERERECLLWVAQGKDTTEIGAILSISDNTTKYHLKNVMHKLGCHNRVQAVVRAIQLGLIYP
ncbi:autoinducer binding domain-containing protein [Komagataeibacter xylinus]|uniref:autoinducer binding domain-containing protein n=3 Tax=Komagataeibacter xylinus TaxID=28448 RepID=UPI000FDF6D89|nr:autoinducer binding domain-containing protein [Komagataeibacter xylinus]AZV38311.1 LuxR family transcriptional regulator [Komagataeibacter xylinus]